MLQRLVSAHGNEVKTMIGGERTGAVLRDAVEKFLRPVVSGRRMSQLNDALYFGGMTAEDGTASW